MKQNLYVIYDKTAEEAGPIFQAVNNGVALRQVVNVLKPLPASLRDEYKLVKVGEFDTLTMKVCVCNPEEIDYSIAIARSEEYAFVEVEND